MGPDNERYSCQISERSDENWGSLLDLKKSWWRRMARYRISSADYVSSGANNYSTILAIIEIIENILEALQSGKMVAGIYLDLSKAFDTVDHNVLLYKLETYGIRGLPLKWFKSYLTERKQYTSTKKKILLQHNQIWSTPGVSTRSPTISHIHKWRCKCTRQWLQTEVICRWQQCIHCLRWTP